MWTSSETLPAARHRRQHVLEPLQSAEVPLRPGLLRDPEHLGRLGAAELLEVSQSEHLPVDGVEAVQAPPGPAAAARRAGPPGSARCAGPGASTPARPSWPRAERLVERDLQPRVPHPGAQVLAMQRRQPPADVQPQPEQRGELRVGQVGVEVAGDVEERLLEDVRGVEPACAARRCAAPPCGGAGRITVGRL